MVPFEDEYKKN